MLHQKTKKEKKKIMTQKIPEWIREKQATIEKETEEWQKEHGDFFVFPEGETEILVDLQNPPQKKLTKFGSIQWQYKATVNGEQKTIGASVMLDKQIIYALMQEINPMIIIRVGKEKSNTRYSVKGLE